MSAYDDDDETMFADLKIGESANLRVGEEEWPFIVTATFRHAFHSGRRLYAVACLACCCSVASETTGPESTAKQHVFEVHRQIGNLTT